MKNALAALQLIVLSFCLFGCGARYSVMREFGWVEIGLRLDGSRGSTL